MKTIRTQLKSGNKNQSGINMVDLMMWLVIAALLLASAIQSIGYYQRAALVYQMSTSVDSIATTATALAASNGRVVHSDDIQEAIAQTRLEEGVTVEWGTLPSYASDAPDSDYGFSLASASTTVPGAAPAGTVYVIKATHESLNKEEVVYVFDNTANREAGVAVVTKGSSPLNGEGDAPTSGNGATSYSTTTGTPVVSKMIGQKVTLQWGAVAGASGYTVTAGGITKNINGASINSTTFTFPTGTTATATVKAIVDGTPSADSSPANIVVPSHEVVVKATGGKTFDASDVTGNTGSINDLVTTTAGSSMLSQNGQYLLTYRKDGDLIIYDTTTERAVYSTHTATPRKAGRMVLQSDGNLVAYELVGSSSYAISATGTWGLSLPGTMVLEDDGTLKIRDSAGVIKYNSAVPNHFLSPYSSSITGAPVVKTLGQKVTVAWNVVPEAIGYKVFATGTPEQYVSGASNATATFTMPTAYTGDFRVQAVFANGNAPISHGSVAYTPHSEISSSTGAIFKKAAITGSTNSLDDIVSTPRGTSIMSPNGKYLATFREDGDFILYDTTTKQALLATHTATPRKANSLNFQQGDANFVAYEESNVPIKSTGTDGIPLDAKLSLGDDGAIKITDSTGTVRYNSSVTNSFMKAP